MGKTVEDLKQQLTESSYFRQEELVFADCDPFQRVRVSALLTKVASFAGYDYDARGLTHDKLYAMREVFLLSRVALQIHRCPVAGEVLDITTWENGARGAHMQRVYEMADRSGAVCVSAREQLDLGRLADAEDPAPGVLYRQGADGVPQGDRLPGPEKDTAAPGGTGGAGEADGALVRLGW